MYIHVPPVNIMMVLFCLASHNPLSLNHTARYSQLGLGTRLHNDAMFFSCCVADFLPPDAEAEPDIGGGSLQDIWQHSDHTHTA